MTSEQINANRQLADSAARELGLSAQGIAIHVDSEGHYHISARAADGGWHRTSLLAESSWARLYAHAKGFADNVAGKTMA